MGSWAGRLSMEHMRIPFPSTLPGAETKYTLLIGTQTAVSLANTAQPGVQMNHIQYNKQMFTLKTICRCDITTPPNSENKKWNYILQPNIWHTRHLIEQKTQQNWIILCKSCFFKSWIFHFITSKKNLFSSGRWTLTSEYLWPCPLWVCCTARHMCIFCTWEKNSYCIFFFSL